MEAVRYKVPIDVYPRFRYFQKRLASIIPRWEKLVATGKFEQCISQGDVTLRIIMKAAKYLQGDVSVTVVGDNVTIPANFPSELQVGVGKDLEGEITHEAVDKKRLVEDMRLSSKFHPHIHICLITSDSSTLSVKQLLDQFSSLENEQQENVIVYDVGSKKNYSFSELKEVKYNKDEIRPGPVNEAVGLQIQHLLEDRAVMILEAIVGFNNNFAPEDGEDCGMSIELECSDQIVNSLKDPHIVDDLDPEKTCIADPSAKDTGDEPRKLSEEQMDSMFFENLMEFIIKKTKTIFCDNLAKKYGIKPSLVNEFLNEGFYNYERKYRAGVNGMVKPRWAKAKTCSEASTIAYNYVTRQVKTLNAVEHYLKRVLKVLVEFEKLNFEVFGLLRKTKVQVEVKIPVYPEMPAKMTDELLSLPEVDGCGTLYGKLTIHVRPDLKKEEEEKIKTQINDILTEHQYQQSFKLLTLTGRYPQVLAAVDNRFKSGEQLKAQLNKKTAEEIDRYLFGTLGCFIGLREKPNSGQKSMEGGGTSNVAGLYCITAAHCFTDCSPAVQVKQGQAYTEFGQLEHVLDKQVKIIDEQVKIDEPVKIDNQVKIVPVDEEVKIDELVKKLDEQVNIDEQVKKNIDIDIAAIRITGDTTVCNPDITVCNPDMSVYNPDITTMMPRWEFYTGDAVDASLVANAVYKHGATSGYTEGIIISNDYKPELRKNYRDSLQREANIIGGHDFHEDFLILIDILPASQLMGSLYSPDTDVFQPQDSGDPGPVLMSEECCGTRSAPVFTSPLPLTTIKKKAKETFVLECVVGGQPKPQVSWYHKDVMVTQTEDILLETEGDTHRLVIKTAYHQHTGVYCAAAVNSAGREESSCTLEVEKEVFSKEGDSGSVIYFTNIDDGSVRLLSLLGGTFKYPEDGVEQSVTYSSHLKKSLDALCESCNCEIVMPWDILEHNPAT